MNVIVYGTGQVAQNYIDFFLQNKEQINVKCFTQTNPTQTEFYGYEVRPASQLDISDVDYIVMAMAAGGAAVEYLKTMYDGIEEMYLNDKIMRVEMFCHFFKENRLDDPFGHGYGLNKDEKREKKIIVSLTSYSKRFQSVCWSIDSIFCQSVKADKVILYLDEGEKIPERLSNLQSRGLEIQVRPERMRSHKKYYYAMKEYPEDIVITIDDDVYYEKDMIKLLLESYKKYPNAVSAKRVHRILKDSSGNLLNYNSWDEEYDKMLEPSMQLLATGVGGVLYPPKCMSEELFNAEVFMSICLQADDVWLKFMQILNETPVVYVPGEYIHPMSVVANDTCALSVENVGNNRNDLLIANVENEYCINLADYAEEYTECSKTLI